MGFLKSVNQAVLWTGAVVQGLKDSNAEIDAGSSFVVSKPGMVLGCVGGGGGGGGRDPSCIDRKYLVAACLSCSLSSAVWRLEDQLIAC